MHVYIHVHTSIAGISTIMAVTNSISILYTSVGTYSTCICLMRSDLRRWSWLQTQRWTSRSSPYRPVHWQLAVLRGPSHSESVTMSAVSHCCPLIGTPLEGMGGGDKHVMIINGFTLIDCARIISLNWEFL